MLEEYGKKGGMMSMLRPMPAVRGLLTLALAALVAVALLMTMPADPALGLSRKACRVKNLDTGVTKRSLQAAVDVAKNGHRLTVRGVCRGTTKIGKSLKITGIRPRGAARPTLDGDREGSVVHVPSDFRCRRNPACRGRTVVIKRLTITGGSGSFTDQSRHRRRNGGGILNEGDLKLRSVRVTGNAAEVGGGIYNVGTLSLHGSTSISTNTPNGVSNVFKGAADRPRLTLHDRSTISDHMGGGVSNSGTLKLKDSSRIVRNSDDFSGGGVHNGGTLILKHSSRISGNHAPRGGGVYNFAHDPRRASTILMGSSQITGNTAPAGQGGGVYDAHGTFDTSQCGPGKRVHDNIGGDCAP